MTCHNCRTPNRTDATFCGRCGVRLVELDRSWVDYVYTMATTNCASLASITSAAGKVNSATWTWTPPALPPSRIPKPKPNIIDRGIGGGAGIGWLWVMFGAVIWWIVALIALFALSGCRYVEVTTPDGVTVKAGSLLTDPALDGASFKSANGEFNVSGYASKSQELGAIIGAAVKAAK